MEPIARRWLVPFIAAAPVVALTAACILEAGHRDLLRDSASMVASLTASILCAISARRTVGVERAWRLAIAVGMLGLFAGTTGSAIDKLVSPIPSESPSVADIGLFSLPIAALFALSCFARAPEGQRRHAPPVLILDSLAVIASLLVVISLTGFGRVFSVNTAGSLAYVSQVAYVGLNFALMVVIPTLWLARRVSKFLRLQLALVGLGLLILAASNCFHIYGMVTGSPETDFSSFGYILGPIVIIMAASRIGAGATASPATAALLRRTLVTLPYFVVAFAGAAVAFSFIIRHELNPTALALGWLVSMVVLARQVFILKEDNDRLNDLTAAQSQLIYLADHDTLTGIANRSCFDRHLAQALSASKNDTEPLAIFFIDVDDFKSINDRYGHVAGDELLALLAGRLKRCVREGDIVARIGGDEFALLLRRAAMSAAVSKRILDAVQQPYRLRAGPVVASVSVGMIDLRGGQDDLSAEDLMERVDTAMYEAKKLRGSALVMVDADRLTAHQTRRGA